MLDAMTAAVERAGRADGPAFLELRDHRWGEHVGPGEDYALGYRNREASLRPWIADDQVPRLGAMLADGPIASRSRPPSSTARSTEAVAFAEASPFPDPRELLTDVWAV